MPVKNLFDYLARDYSVEEFLENFPTVGREQVFGVLELERLYSGSSARDC